MLPETTALCIAAITLLSIASFSYGLFLICFTRNRTVRETLWEISKQNKVGRGPSLIIVINKKGEIVFDHAAKFRRPTTFDDLAGTITTPHLEKQVVQVSHDIPPFVDFVGDNATPNWLGLDDLAFSHSSLVKPIHNMQQVVT